MALKNSNKKFLQFNVHYDLFYELENINDIFIVIPTYNEAHNIVSLLDLIFDQYEHYKEMNQDNLSLRVLVVDDNSPDGTSNLIRDYMKQNKNVLLYLREKKEGLGAAYIAGMKYVLDNYEDVDVIFEMDADHSHNPKDIFRMIEEIRKGNDFVIGSRYVDGGSVPENWGLHRKIISFFASTISRYAMGLGEIQDCSGGFRAIRADVLRTIDLEELNVKGYAFQIALLEEAVYHGFKVKEIPIQFEERMSGQSKMRVSDALEGWKVIFQVKKKRFASYIKNLFS